MWVVWLICFRLRDQIPQICYMIADMLLSAPPCAPNPGRWLKLYASLNFYVLGCSLNWTLIHLIRRGWSQFLDEAAISAMFTEGELNGHDEHSEDPSIKMGKRKSRVQLMINDYMFVRVRGPTYPPRPPHQRAPNPNPNPTTPRSHLRCCI